MSSARLRLVHGCDRERAGKIGAKNSEEKKIALWLHARQRHDVIAQMPLGQQVGEEHGQAGSDGARRDDQPARLSFE